LRRKFLEKKKKIEKITALLPKLKLPNAGDYRTFAAN
jgi:hypothetical protein